MVNLVYLMIVLRFFFKIQALFNNFQDLFLNLWQFNVLLSCFCIQKMVL